MNAQLVTKKPAARKKASIKDKKEEPLSLPCTIDAKDLRLYDVIESGSPPTRSWERAVNGAVVTDVLNEGFVGVSSGTLAVLGRKFTLLSRGELAQGRKLQVFLDGMSRFRSFVKKSGSDPEVFIETLEGAFTVPAFEVLPSKNPDNERPYWDGWQGEFSTNPHACLSFQIDSVAESLHALYKTLPKELTVSDKTVVDVDLRAIRAHADKAMFGCTPSLNAYGDFPIPSDGLDVPVRMSGGHIHLGCDNGMPSDRMNRLIKILDKIVGVISVALFRDHDDPRRREYYGRAGEYRLPEHGIEYRVLSNAWLCHPVVAHYMHELTRRVAGGASSGVGPTDITDEEVQQVINTCDADMAIMLIERNKKVFELVVGRAVSDYELAKTFFWKAMYTGIKVCLPEKKTLLQRWHVGPDLQWEAHSESPGCSIRNIGKQAAKGLLL